MEGNVHEEPERGIIPRACQAIFDALENEDKYDVSRNKVVVSYLEIYNEELSDLLVDAGDAEASKPPKIMASKERGVTVSKCYGLKQTQCETVTEISELLAAAQNRRQIAATQMNK